MNRRQFLTGAVAAAVVVPLSDFEFVLESARPAFLTLTEWAVRNGEGARVAAIAQLLSDANDMLEDLPWQEVDSRVLRVKLPRGWQAMGSVGL